MSRPIELMQRYDTVIIFARHLSDQFRSTPAGDEYLYKGGMQDVEDLREALDDLESYMLEHGVNVPERI